MFGCPQNPKTTLLAVGLCVSVIRVTTKPCTVETPNLVFYKNHMLMPYESIYEDRSNYLFTEAHKLIRVHNGPRRNFLLAHFNVFRQHSI